MERGWREWRTEGLRVLSGSPSEQMNDISSLTISCGSPKSQIVTNQLHDQCSILERKDDESEWSARLM